MKSLIEKMREVSSGLQKSPEVQCHVFCTVVAELMDANVCIVDNNNTILGCCPEPLKTVNFAEGQFVEHETGRDVEKTLIIPFYTAGQQAGSIILSREKGQFVTDDIILAEYAAALLSTAVTREKTSRIEEKIRSRIAVQSALAALTYSETHAVLHILDKIEGSSGLLIASKIANEFDITKSVIVNALRKLQSASIIRSRSLGVKGTYIEILKSELQEEATKLARNLEQSALAQINASGMLPALTG